MRAVPEIGKEYHFFDDGKTGPSRHYICRVERLIPKGEAKNIVFPELNESLYNIWLREVKDCYWLYAEDTDFFIEASCPTYDDNTLWFARTKDGGWFSMNIQSDWQSGELDSEGELFNRVINNRRNISDYISVTYYKK